MKVALAEVAVVVVEAVVAEEEVVGRIETDHLNWTLSSERDRQLNLVVRLHLRTSTMPCPSTFHKSQVGTSPVGIISSTTQESMFTRDKYRSCQVHEACVSKARH